MQDDWILRNAIAREMLDRFVPGGRSRLRLEKEGAVVQQASRDGGGGKALHPPQWVHRLVPGEDSVAQNRGRGAAVLCGPRGRHFRAQASGGGAAPESRTSALPFGQLTLDAVGY